MKRVIQSIGGALVIHLLAGAFFFFAIWMGAWSLNELNLGWISTNAGLLIIPGTILYAAICFGLGRLLMPAEKSARAFLRAAWPGFLIAICCVISIIQLYPKPIGEASVLINAMFATPFTFFLLSSFQMDTFTTYGIAKLLLYCAGCVLCSLLPAVFIWLGGVRKLKKRQKPLNLHKSDFTC